MKRSKGICEMVKLRTGEESYSAYVPSPLPPKPPLELEPLYSLLDDAMLALGRLDGASQAIPDVSKLHGYLQRQPVSDTAKAVENTGLTLPTVIQSFKALEKLKIVRETSGRKRGKLYAYTEYLDALNKGAEPFKT